MPEGSDLAQRLRGRGCDTVLITGVATNVCCESSAPDAAQMNFRTIMVSDATAANDPVAHRSALATFYSIFGDVMPADMVSSDEHTSELKSLIRIPYAAAS